MSIYDNLSYFKIQTISYNITVNYNINELYDKILALKYLIILTINFFLYNKELP